LTNCKECGAKMYYAGTTDDKMLLICTKHPEHRLEREISPREKRNQMIRVTKETPIEAQKNMSELSKERSERAEEQAISQTVLRSPSSSGYSSERVPDAKRDIKWKIPGLCAIRNRLQKIVTFVV